mmetsp:Transcript_14551/g.21716  ORF Transcript_14551/g.21716 Transcript_14551/m.21716 type:complete len:141 (+) Transcript_14551:38-460(+)
MDDDDMYGHFVRDVYNAAFAPSDAAPNDDDSDQNSADSGGDDSMAPHRPSHPLVDDDTVATGLYREGGRMAAVIERIERNLMRSNAGPESARLDDPAAGQSSHAARQKDNYESDDSFIDDSEMVVLKKVKPTKRGGFFPI